MKKNGLICLLVLAVPAVLLELGCHQNSGSAASGVDTTMVAANNFGGFKSQVDWGQHLVMVGGCGDCHTPKKMTPQGPMDDSSLLLSGHPNSMPIADVDQKSIEGKGFAVTNDQTSWIGPWGVSFTYNLTPDPTGMGGWTEDQFSRAIRQGKYMGSPDGRQLLPPMPWEDYANFTDQETAAIFAYLQSIKPIHNIILPAIAPVVAPGPPPGK